MKAYIDTSTYVKGSFRLRFDARPVANGYPSKGGYLNRRVAGVEMDWLGLDKMREIQTSGSQPEEDELCLKLRRLGAKWWSYPGQEGSIEDRIKNYPDGPIEIETGWPNTGEGVWVLRTKKYDRGRAAVRQCKSMDERSQLIKELGGTFYRDPEECPELSSDWGEIPCVTKTCGHYGHDPRIPPPISDRVITSLSFSVS